MEKIHLRCPCKRINCPRHGKCDLCRRYHLGPGKKYSPACERIRKKTKERK